MHAKTEVLKLLNWQIASTPTPAQASRPADASATKIYGTELAIEVYRLLMEVLGANADGPHRLARRRCWPAGSSGCTAPR